MEPSDKEKVVKKLIEDGVLMSYRAQSIWGIEVCLFPIASTHEKRLIILFEILQRYPWLHPPPASLSSVYTFLHATNSANGEKLSLDPRIRYVGFDRYGCVICGKPILSSHASLVKGAILIRGRTGYRCEDCHKADIRRCNMCMYTDCKKERCMYHIVWVLRQKTMLKDLCRFMVRLLRADAHATCL